MRGRSQLRYKFWLSVSHGPFPAVRNSSSLPRQRGQNVVGFIHWGRLFGLTAGSFMAAGNLSRPFGQTSAVASRMSPLSSRKPWRVAQADRGAWTDRLKRAKTKISMNIKARYLDDNLFIERLWRSPSMNASTCTPGKPDRRPEPASGAGLRFATTSNSASSMADNPPPWSTSTQ